MITRGQEGTRTFPHHEWEDGTSSQDALVAETTSEGASIPSRSPPKVTGVPDTAIHPGSVGSPDIGNYKLATMLISKYIRHGFSSVGTRREKSGFVLFQEESADVKGRALPIDLDVLQGISIMDGRGPGEGLTECSRETRTTADSNEASFFG